MSGQVSDLEIAQATILSCITLLYSSSPTHEKFGMAGFTSVVGFSSRDWANILASVDATASWEDWIAQQSTIRTVYAIWVSLARIYLMLSSNSFARSSLTVLWATRSMVIRRYT